MTFEVAAVLVVAAIGAVVGWSLARRTPSVPAKPAAAPGATPEHRPFRDPDDLAELLDHLEAAVVGLDASGSVVVANRAARFLLGRDGASLLGRSAMEVFVDHRMEGLLAEARSGGSASGELLLREAAERTVIARARRSVDGVWLVLEDVTELRRLQRIRTEFVDNLSHELRTPVTTVRLLAEAVARDLETAAVPDRIRERVRTIDVESGHLAQMVTELLDLARIEGGATQLWLDEVDVAAVARAASERLTPFADRQGVTLEVDVADGVPRISGDGDRLEQLLINLLHNAVKFSPQGGVVTTSVRIDGDQLVLSVADRGVGVPADELDRIFERFYKVDKARVRGRGGTGLGLAIARHIAESHGGRIWAESEEGRGSTFSVALPLEPVRI